MKKLMLLCLVLAVACTSAQARIGETLEQLKKRYGKPQGGYTASVNWGNGEQQYPFGENIQFKVESWTVTCTVINGRCERVEYSRNGQSTSEQIQALLDRNSQGSHWTAMDDENAFKKWAREDGVIASVRKDAGEQTLEFFIETPVYKKAREAALAQAEAGAKKVPDNF